MEIVLSIVITAVLAFFSRRIIEENYEVPIYMIVVPLIFSIVYIY